MKRNWMHIRRNKRVGDFVKNIRRGNSQAKISMNHPIASEDFVHRPFVDKDIALWEFAKRTNGKGLALIKDTEDPGAVRKNLNNSFHYSLAPVFFIAGVIGLFPLYGLTSKDPSKVRFIWFSWRTLYTLSNLAIGISVVSLSLYRIYLDGLDLNKAGALVFYTTVTINLVLFLQLSLQWADVVKHVTTSEIACPFALYSGDTRKWSQRTKFMVIIYSIMLISSLEHGWSNLSLLTSAYACATDNSVAYDFYTQSYPPIFRVMKYDFWKGFLMQIWNAIATAVWNFMDVFLIIISLALIHRFKQLSFWLDMTNGKHVSEQFWKTMRNEYNRLSSMVKRVDRAVNNIMLLSFAANLYIICEQMFNSLKEKNFNEGQTECENKKDELLWPAIIDIVYFTFSFSYLIFRFLGVAMMAAEVYASARVPKELLHSVPTYNYCVEIENYY